MSQASPYIIQQVQLQSDLLEIVQTHNVRKRYYLVFWWRNVPLGDMYLEAGYIMVEDKFRKEVQQAIHPTINYYLAALKLPNLNYSAGFVSDYFFRVETALTAIETTYFTSPLPDIIDVSVIICTRNRSGHLKACLDSLQNQVSLPVEIIVVDNAPSDGQTKELVELYHNVIYCYEPRKGLDIARNSGAYLATCSVIAYADDDVLLHPLWAYGIWTSFTNPEIAAITGLVLALDLSSEAQQIFEQNWSFNRGYIDRLYNRTFINSSKAPPVWNIGAGANMAFRKSVLAKTGFFDERLDVGASGCNGDSEMWYRILLNGYTILYNPRIVSYHTHRPHMNDLKKQIYYYMRGHVVASLIQHYENRDAGYYRYVFLDLPKYYLILLKAGFPSFSSRYTTLFSEVRGLLSGIVYFYKNRRSPARNLT